MRPFSIPMFQRSCTGDEQLQSTTTKMLQFYIAVLYLSFPPKLYTQQNELVMYASRTTS